MERLLIFYLDLARACTGASLDELASDEERLEAVLFHNYYGDYSTTHEVPRHPHEPAGTTTTTTQRRRPGAFADGTSKEDIVAFLGLCTALYQLPESLRDCSRRRRSTTRTWNEFPDAHDDDDDDDDKRDSPPALTVQLSHGRTLVFVPLVEHNNNNNTSTTSTTSTTSSSSTPLILAVAQISTRHATVHAVHQALERAHQGFGLWRGGGMDRRLRQSVPNGKQIIPTTTTGPETETTTTTSSHDCIYPGMDELYRLRKRLRQLGQQQQQHGATSEQQQRQQLLVRRQVTDLARRLPIAAVRHDLAIHYPAAILCGDDDDGAATDYYRNIVQGLPPPIPWNHPPPDDLVNNNDCSTSRNATSVIVEPTDDVVQRVTEAMDRLLVDDDECAWPLRQQQPVAECPAGDPRVEPRLWGISAFYRGKICLPTRTIFSKSYSLSNDTAVAILWYMSRFQWMGSCGGSCSSNISHPSSAPVRATTTTTSPSSTATLRPFALQFTADAPDIPVRTTHHTHGFLPPPPLSVLSSLDEVHSFWGPPDKEDASTAAATTTTTIFESTYTSQVWCPPVCLPFEPNCGKKNSLSGKTPLFPQQLDARVCLYCRGEFSFLLYLSCPSFVSGMNPSIVLDSVDSSPPSSLYQNLFVTVQTELETAVPVNVKEPDPLLMSTTTTTTADAENVPCHKWPTPGLDVIWIDRRRHSLVLFRDPRKHHDNGNNNRVSNTAATSSTPSSSTSTKNLMVGLFGKNSQASPNSSASTTSSIAEPGKRSPMGSNLGFWDCRYHLAANLSRDATLAFEDAFDEVQSFRQQASRSAVDGEENNKTARILELCTLLSSQWMYTFAQGDHELYIVLDLALFVTMADVQNAVQEVRRELLGHESEQQQQQQPPTL